jgi:hypothetical protein
VGADGVGSNVSAVVENVLMHGGAEHEHVLNSCMPGALNKAGETLLIIKKWKYLNLWCLCTSYFGGHDS